MQIPDTVRKALSIVDWAHLSIKDKCIYIETDSSVHERIDNTPKDGPHLSTEYLSCIRAAFLRWRLPWLAINSDKLDEMFSEDEIPPMPGVHNYGKKSWSATIFLIDIHPLLLSIPDKDKYLNMLYYQEIENMLDLTGKYDKEEKIRPGYVPYYSEDSSVEYLHLPSGQFVKEIKQDADRSMPPTINEYLNELSKFYGYGQ